MRSEVVSNHPRHYDSPILHNYSILSQGSVWPRRIDLLSSIALTFHYFWRYWSKNHSTWKWHWWCLIDKRHTVQSMGPFILYIVFHIFVVDLDFLTRVQIFKSELCDKWAFFTFLFLIDFFDDWINRLFVLILILLIDGFIDCIFVWHFDLIFHWLFVLFIRWDTRIVVLFFLIFIDIICLHC